MKQATAYCLAWATNWGLTRLRNGVDLQLTREEFRFLQGSFAQFGEDPAGVKWVRTLRNVEPFLSRRGLLPSGLRVERPSTVQTGLARHHIDLEEEKIALFNQLRPRDINIVAACSNVEQEMLSFKYGGGVTKRIGPVGNDKLESVVGEEPAASAPVHTKALDQILSELPSIERIEYLNIDCEGHDLEVLQSFGLKRYRPPIITIEAFLSQETRLRLTTTLSDAGYEHKETFDRTLLYVVK